MRSDILERVSVDLLSVPALIFRGLRRKLLRTGLATIDLDITPLHFEIIRVLEEAGTLHIAEIGQRLQVARAQMTQLIDKLVDLNLVERKTDIADRRTISITLTNRGKAFLDKHKANLTSAVQETLSCLADKELEDLSDSLRKLRDILSRLQ